MGMDHTGVELVSFGHGAGFSDPAGGHDDGRSRLLCSLAAERW